MDIRTYLTLNEQLVALLDLMQNAEGYVDIKSIQMAAEMCIGLADDMKSEVEVMAKENKNE